MIGAGVRDSCGKSESMETPQAQKRRGRTACGASFLSGTSNLY
ncbi:hypothetical protein ACIP97_24955 [Peribacillus frigoritolerans]